MAKIEDKFDNFEDIRLTYDDILLKIQYSDFIPSDANLETNLTKKIKLKIPVVSAAMDTVTEAKLAIAIALEGGIGMIHRNMTPEQQAKEVMKVKRFESGFVEDPATLAPTNTLGDARAIKYNTVPITDDGTSHGKLVGLLSSKDYYFDDSNDDNIEKYMKPFEELAIEHEGITLEEANLRLKESKRGKLIIINNDQERKLVSMVTRNDLEKNYEFPTACKDDLKRLRVGAAVGPSDIEKRVPGLVEAGVDVFCIDTSHGHTKNVIDALKYLKSNFDIDVIAGNVATRDGTEALIAAGADAVKVGVGPGAICTTRIVAGVGVPQASAIIDCADAAGDIPIIADGGVKYSGDIAKAIGLGASSVMIGSLFAGTDEAPGETMITEDHRVFKSYRGMGSIGAMQAGSADRYHQTSNGLGPMEAKKLVAEGIEGMVPAIGPLEDHIFQLMGGLKQAMGYVGAKNIPEMREKAIFIRTSPGTSERESHPRVPIVKKAPNYPEY
jgi:IMP dehydrogenase